ncbi:unnamed protein product [Acanthoscelides obtectus]|uniref:ATP synthase F0 subunit 8 n=1 Tax=Acanthoscelides obtectus TaxID=200917 RepID=A0A9P0K6B3_ACAOB|nr:unnamed protein product [Acanthoscelides obtectus]CAK1640346.1 hypothetical protein AOBTE_LOCUS11666 [Acanthoscelides obtectus]
MTVSLWMVQCILTLFIANVAINPKIQKVQNSCLRLIYV